MSGRRGFFTRASRQFGMKDFRSYVAAGVVPLAVVIGIHGFVSQSQAQVNSWTSPVSGNWQDSSWSLGILPGTNQTVMLTNAGWKAVQISPSTAQNFPQTLNVDSITISSPTNTFNTLLLNFAGLGTPLTVKSLSVARNSAMTMFSSALQINGPNGVGMTIGGEFNQNDSVVAGNQINVGDIGSGVYNLNSGTLAVSFLWVGGPFQGVFNQSGGTNAFGITHLDGGEYVLSNGFFGAAISFNNGGNFRQQGGLLQSNLAIFKGSYTLAGGIHEGDTLVPSTDGFSSGNGGVVQTGGTNYGSLDIGIEGFGVYTMSDGVSFAGGIMVDFQGSYNQSGGSQAITGAITLSEDMIAQNAFEGGSFNLSGGQVSSTGMFVGAFYTQTGGTNLTAGDVEIEDAETSLSVSGGLLTADNITAQPGLEGGIFLTGGTLVVTNELSVLGNSSFPDWHGFVGGGQLIVSNISLGPQASFSCSTGTVAQSGMLTLASASLFAGSNSLQFGRLFLSNAGLTNSTLNVPSGANVVHFADSSGVTWSNGPVLVVENWSGSLFGGGQQQIIFGNNAAALIAQQLGQIQFLNPAGLAAGTYSARILPTGEIVPNPGAARLLKLNRQPNGMQLTLQGEIGSNYSIEASTDLLHWVPITSQIDTNGTFSITDTNAANFPSRFYRAKLLP